MSKKNKRSSIILSLLIISIVLVCCIYAAWLANVKASSPEKAAQDFYEWYINYPRGIDKNGYFHDPISDKAYRASKYLTDGMKSRIDDSIKKELTYDPVLLSGGQPLRIRVDKAVIYGKNADVLMNEWFSGKTLPYSIHIDMKLIGSQWMIDDVSISTTISY